jgi:type II secretory pathway pseudopilin PulG
MKKYFLNSHRKGVGLVEIIIGTTILSLVLFAFTSSLSLYSQASMDATKRVQALFLAEEGLEVVRERRDASWVSFAAVSVNVPHGISFSTATSSWSFVSTPDTTGVFTRSITFRDVFRDANGRIVSGTGGTHDPRTRRVEAVVSWSGARGVQSVRLESILANTFE